MLVVDLGSVSSLRRVATSVLGRRCVTDGVSGFPRLGGLRARWRASSAFLTAANERAGLEGAMNVPQRGSERLGSHQLQRSDGSAAGEALTAAADSS